MYEFQLQHALMTNEEVLENYVDVYIHAEDNSIVEGHYGYLGAAITLLPQVLPVKKETEGGRHVFHKH